MTIPELIPKNSSPIIGTSILWRHSNAQRPPLRIGILLDSPQLSRAFAQVIEDIRASNFAQLELLIFRKSAGNASLPSSRLARVARRLFEPKLRRQLLYREYLKMDKRVKGRSHPLDTVDCSDLLAGVDRIEVDPIGKKFIQRFPPDALQAVQAKELDVLIRFGFNILHGDILKAARYGVWSYHHGDNDFYRGGPAHFWELWEKSPLSGVILQVLTEELDGGWVLCKSLFTTEHTLSTSRNRFAPYWGSSDFVIRKLNELHQFGWDYLAERAIAPAQYRGKRKIYKTPTNAEMVRWLAPAVFKKALQYPFRKKLVQHWSIGLRIGQVPLFDSASNHEQVQWVQAPPGHFWADPFLLRQHDKTWLFLEDYSYQNKRGHIACAEVRPDGTLLPPLTCLIGEHHYSYPHVFEVGTDLYMIPESFESKVVSLYRCRTFPDDWVEEARLFEGRFVDTTVWQHDGLWWLATTKAEPDARAGCLLLYYSKDLLDGWKFHPANPISTDIRNNRGAGRVFQFGDQLIRPSQSGCPIYGYNLSFQQITKLSPTAYSECLIKTVTPEVWRGFCSVHTYNRVGEIEVIDAAQRIPIKRLLP